MANTAEQAITKVFKPHSRQKRTLKAPFIRQISFVSQSSCLQGNETLFKGQKTSDEGEVTVNPKFRRKNRQKIFRAEGNANVKKQRADSEKRL